MPIPNNIDFTAFDTLTAAQMDDLIENDTALAAGTAIDAMSYAVTALSNPYKFSAYRNAALNTTAGAYAKVTFDTEEFDTSSNFATGTYTAPVAGFYLFTWLVNYAVLSANNVAALYKNGTIFKKGLESFTTTGGTGAGSGGTLLVSAAANDTFDIYAYSNAVVALTVGPTHNYFQGILMSRT